MIEIGINSEILAQIRAKRKTVEGRLAKGKFLTIRPGDVISIREDIYRDGVIIESCSATLQLAITGVKKYDSFRAMLNDVGYSSAIPDAKNLDQACTTYGLYYSGEDEQRYGVLGISFKVI